MLNTQATISFLDKIEKAYPTKRKIHIFLDNARYYKNQAVKNYLEGSKIQLHFLPPYSPNLNPIERLWKWLKQRVIYNTYYEYFDDFRQTVFRLSALLCPILELYNLNNRVLYKNKIMVWYKMVWYKNVYCLDISLSLY